MPPAANNPLAVLFACGLNAVRSPIAAGLFAQMFGRTTYVVSAGVRKGELDPFAVAVMAEIGIDISRHKPATFEDLDTPVWAERARSELARIPDHQTAGSLTPTEERVAQLAAEGLTNREIAERTFLSPKTVEVNLTRVYRKLGVRRAALANRLAEARGAAHS